ncbi:MAG: PilN domain-containing protein [Gammaproteobacteria bacterium]|jgi:type IV pilus assembly protein PilN|nr:PilN domain-containing protein [Gammaproteobacteria bacterium]
MTRINLLPWRELRRKEERRQFFSVAAGAAVLMGVLVLYAHIHIGGLISAQDQRNKYMRDEIAAVDAKIAEIRTLETKKQQLLARMNIIQELQTRRPEIVHIFDELVRAVPAGLSLTKVSQQGGSIVIEGIAESNARVSAFMRNLDGSDWFVAPRLDVIEADAKAATRSSVFKLTVRQAGQQQDAGLEGSV